MTHFWHFLRFDTILLMTWHRKKLHAENFYVLNILLNLFEISKQVLKFENLIQIWKKISCLKSYFKHGPRRVVQCECIKLYHMIRLNTHTLNHSAKSTFEINFQTGQFIFRFKSNFLISKLVLRFQINSNWFSRHRSFGHKKKS